MTRQEHLAQMTQQPLDVLVIGGGINGAVSLAALSGRGLRVGLIDRKDFASETSMHSSNLVWGGIKYMESYEFGLVRKLCRSRNELMRAFPSNIRELRFYTNLERGFRFPALMLFAGATLYWFMGNCFTRPPRLLTPKRIRNEEPVIDTQRSIGGIEYSDAYLPENDARFVFHFVQSALRRGGFALNYVESLGGERDAQSGLWTVHLLDHATGQQHTVQAKALINACGPYVDRQNEHLTQPTKHQHVFSKGIHLIVNRLTPQERVLTFFADDGRMFFAIPMGKRTVIGTTDTQVPQPETEVTPEDRAFVLSNVNKRVQLERPLTEEDIISERWGVRPLVVERQQDQTIDDWVKMSRKHEIDVDEQRKSISIFGGKLTDCLNIGEEVCALVEGLGIRLETTRERWFGEPDESVRQRFFAAAKAMNLDQRTPPNASEPSSERLWRRYGEDAFTMLEHIRENPEMGDEIIPDSECLRCEVFHARDVEMVQTLEDFLRRRTKISLMISKAELREAQGTREVCDILFGQQALTRWQEFFAHEESIPASLN
jgi:glycerol-3-phosphate dehydrogenase